MEITYKTTLIEALQANKNAAFTVSFPFVVDSGLQMAYRILGTKGQRYAITWGDVDEMCDGQATRLLIRSRQKFTLVLQEITDRREL
jgi:hypothetical protein